MKLKFEYTAFLFLLYFFQIRTMDLTDTEKSLQQVMTYFPDKVYNAFVARDVEFVYVNSRIPDPLFNYICPGQNFKENNESQVKIEEVLEYYKEKGMPFVWWLSGKSNNFVESTLQKNGMLQVSTCHNYTKDLKESFTQDNSDLAIIRCRNRPGINDFEEISTTTSKNKGVVKKYYHNFDATKIKEEDSVKIFIGFNNFLPVVCGILAINGNVAGIYSVTTKEEYRNKKFATQMVKYLLNLAIKENCKVAKIQTKEEFICNTIEKSFGFKKEGDIKLYMPLWALKNS